MIKFLVSICLIATLSVLYARATIVRIEITGSGAAFNGKTFSNVGGYVVLKGKAYGEVDPSKPQNAVITDIQLAPRNARGMVAYATDIYILKPADPAKGNHKLFIELPNRGGKPFGAFNRSRGGNDPGAADQPDDAFLMSMGYTMMWVGWEASQSGGSNMGITVPTPVNKDGSAITGPSYEYISFDDAHTVTSGLAYPAASLDKKTAVLTQRALLNDTPQPMGDTEWEFVNENTIRLLPAGTPFKQSYIYDFVYRAKNPKVSGLGLAAVRDAISFLRYDKADAAGNANPLAGDIKCTYSFTISQPTRFVNDFQTLGFNVDEQGRRVLDGIENWLGGGSGVGINYRFAQTGRTERNRQQHLYPEAIFPFAYNPLSVRTGDFIDLYSAPVGRLSGYTNPANLPKVLEINSANEYWVKAASLLHTDLQGNDLRDPENVRFYLVSGMQHGAGNGNSTGIAQQNQNPTKPEPLLRALFIALDEWVTKGIKPPESNVPRRYNNTAALAIGSKGLLTGVVNKRELNWPDIPGVTYNGLITMRYKLDYGGQFGKGIIEKYPTGTIDGEAYINFVSKVDADGNEVAGIRLPPVAAPTATLTGWGLRREGFGLNDGAESAGQNIPFKKTKAERLSVGDPRLSLEERYGTHQKYVDAVTKAVKDLQAKRLLLSEDAANYIKEAEGSGVLK